MVSPVGERLSNEEIVAMIRLHSKELQQIKANNPINGIAQRALIEHSDEQKISLEAANTKLKKGQKRVRELTVSGSNKFAKAMLVVGEKAVKDAGMEATARFLSISIPGVGVVTGAGSAYYRYKNGDSLGAVAAEVASAIASCFPGFGTCISLGIDGSLFVLDCKKLEKSISPAPLPVLKYQFKDLNSAYQSLGLSGWKEGDPKPNKKVVDKNYRRVAAQYHPDKFANDSKVMQKQAEESMKIINAAREHIFKNRGWKV